MKVVKGLKTHNKDWNLIKLEERCNYYKDLMTDQISEFLENEEEKITEEVQKPEITVDQIKEAVFKMKTRQTPRSGNVNIELSKNLPDVLLEFWEKIFNFCLTRCKPSTKWKTSYTTPTYKKGSRRNCTSFYEKSSKPE